ncbi:MAG: HAMP domain-containing protein [Polyangiaceae bacterium]|nr:HAMP domain-containing protein [Polyangiaceae bacterium]
MTREPTAPIPDPLDPAQAAEYALVHRPGFTIRKKIALSFLACFVVIGAVTLASSVILRRIEQRLHFLELADIYTSNIQQARRYEKNYFLYGTDLASALEHVADARRTLAGAHAHFDQVVGAKTHREMVRHIERYEHLVTRLRQGDIVAAQSKQAAEVELRQHGGQMVEVALHVAEAERQRVRRLLQLSKNMPIAALVLLLALILYVVHFLTRQILGPLGRMVDYARRIADGDFSPIFPARRYRDEFTGLVLAMNRMMHELHRRQEMLADAQKLRAIGTLTAGVAHELNNPLNNISLTVESLLEDYETLRDEERLSMARDLLAQTERAQGVVRSLLDFSRQRQPRMEALDIGALLSQTNKLLANQVKLAHTRLEFSVAEGLPPVRGDGQQLAQVFVNLYLNAIEAMGRDGHLQVVARSQDDRPGFVRVDIRDSGRGIPDNALRYIFDPFFTTKGAKGTGLGLSVSYGIVAKHEGTIEVESKVGEGTTFSVLLPVARVEVAPKH